jgi:D-hydroxyproline dehydrogenase subunit beta
MRPSREHLQADVAIVGAGIVGLAHALAARERGLSVVVLERDSRAVGASVRNFGHVFVGGQADGADFDLALASRERWLRLAARSGMPLVAAGSLVLARAEDEMAVLEETAARPERAARLLTPAEVGELAPVPTAGLVGGMHSTLDIRVDPRASVAALVGLLSEDPGAEVRWDCRVHAAEPGRLHAGAGLTVEAPRIIVCPGPHYRDLAPELVPGLEPLTLCRLQMLRVGAPDGRRYGPALVTGLSLIRYPGFARRPSAAALRRRLEAERPELLANGIHLLITQLPEGDLVVGDTHAYGDTLDGFGDEHLDDLLLAEAVSVLGADRLTVRERWHGIYATRPGATEPFHITAPLEGVRVVENVVGLGMTLSLGAAEATLDLFEVERPAPATR